MPELDNATQTSLKLEQLQRQLEAAQRELRGLYDAQSTTSLDLVGKHLGQPLTYLLVQLSLADRGQPVDSASLIQSIRLLIDACTAAGVNFVGTCAELVRFDPNLHIPADSNISPGEEVRIEVPGVVMPSGRVVRRAVVKAT